MMYLNYRIREWRMLSKNFNVVRENSFIIETFYSVRIGTRIFRSAIPNGPMIILDPEFPYINLHIIIQSKITSSLFHSNWKVKSIYWGT